LKSFNFIEKLNFENSKIEIKNPYNDLRTNYKVINQDFSNSIISQKNSNNHQSLNNVIFNYNEKNNLYKNNLNQINNIPENTYSNKIISNNKKDEKIVYKEFRHILKEKTIKKSILVRFFQTCVPCCIGKNKNLRLLINLQDFISEELDIVKILKKLIEYENFKGLIFTENQRKIFNIMQKRVMTREILLKDASDYYKDFYFKNKMKDLKNFKYLVDHLFDFDEENKFSKMIMEKLKDNFSL